MRRSAAGIAVMVASAAAGVHADPMRPLPPPAGAASSPSAASTAAVPAATRREAAAPAPAREPGRLVAIREDSRGQRQALIGERWAGVGDRLDGGATVRSIDINSVELVDGKALTVLHLLPPLVASGTPAETTVTAGNGGPLPARAPRAPLRRSAAPTPIPPEGPPR